MNNQFFIGFLVLGIAVTMGILLAALHEMQWAAVLFGLAAIQLLVLLLNWRRQRKQRRHYRPTHRNDRRA